jgi:predicted homoserine dehydrogenase-like protein
MYRPYHLIGLELTVSILKAGLRGEATGSPTGFSADVIATAKRHLTSGEVLDGEGGYSVYGVLMPAEEALKSDGLPIGLAHNVRLKNDVVANQPIRWSDIEYDKTDSVVQFRRKMERGMAKK